METSFRCLLIRQGLPGEDMGADRFHMAVPGDLVYPEEGLDEAAYRILSNLTSLDRHLPQAVLHVW